MTGVFAEAIYNCYNSRYHTAHGFLTGPTYGYSINNANLLSDSGAFTKFMKVPIDDDIIELPCVYKYPILRALKTNNDLYIRNGRSGLKEVYIPMLDLDTRDSILKSSNPAIKHFFSGTPPCTGLSSAFVSDTEYLGGEGIILYEDFTPLIMFTLQVKRERHPDRYMYTPINRILRINPQIYNRNDILAKYLKSKFISNLLEFCDHDNFSHALYRRAFHTARGLNLFTPTSLPFKFKIIIEDFSEFFVTPNIPDGSFDNDAVNRTLALIIPDMIDTIESEYYDNNSL